MEIRLNNVVLNESTVFTPFSCVCKGAANTKPLSGDDAVSSELQEGIRPNTITISFSVPFDDVSVVEQLEEYFQAEEEISISSDDYFKGEIERRKVRTVKITSFETKLSVSANGRPLATSCSLVLLQKNSPNEVAKRETDQNMSVNPTDPASGFSISETIAHHSAKQTAIKGLFYG